MSKFSYVEDLFVEFYDHTFLDVEILQAQDTSAIHSFYNQISLGNQLTVNQGNFLLKILTKYKSHATQLGIDYGTLVDAPVWKNSFRKLDLSKRAFVEETEDGEINICLKFPYLLKDTFDKEFDTESQGYAASQWDSDRKLRVLDVCKFNVIHLEEFLRKHEFELDESFLTLVDTVAEIWDQQEQIIPRAELVNNSVVLINASEDALNFYQSHRTDNINHDLFLAKSMGYPVQLNRSPVTHVETICQETSKYFWLKVNSDFFNLYKEINGVACILVDRNTQDVVAWLEKFVGSADIAGVPRSEIKVCFRDPIEKKSKLNEWVKDNNLGGKVEGGKILIFLHKPPKWLFKDNIDVKIVITNSYTPINEPTMSSWLAAHPCVCYLGEIKPTPIRKQKIVSL
jgi:hypothetical protein